MRQSLQSLQAKLSFSSKEIVALSCAWCKTCYHNKESCFNPDRIGEECVLGEFLNLVILITTTKKILFYNYYSFGNIKYARHPLQHHCATLVDRQTTEKR